MDDRVAVIFKCHRSSKFQIEEVVLHTIKKFHWCLRKTYIVLLY